MNSRRTDEHDFRRGTRQVTVPPLQMPTLMSVDTALTRVKTSGNNKNPLVADVMACLAVDPRDAELMEIVEFETQAGLIEAEIRGNPFVSCAPVQADLYPATAMIMGRVPETGALWSLSDEPILCHVLGVGGSGVGGKTSWLLMIAAEILAHENGGMSCPYTHQNAGLLRP